MSGLSQRPQDTVVSIIGELERQNVPYAIARNYENYPDFGHDLDLFYSDTLEGFKKIAVTMGKQHDWDLVSYCDHWSRSPIHEHNIDVFHFYKFDPMETLQVDLFRGFLILGLPLINAKDIIRSRELHESGLFHHTGLALENILRLLQIHALLSAPNTEKKVKRYREKVLTFADSNRRRMLDEAEKMRLPLHTDIFDALSVEDYQQFKTLLDRVKRRFIMSAVQKFPIQTARQLLARISDNNTFLPMQLCGSRILVQANEEGQKELVRTALDRLAASDFITSWRERRVHGFLTIPERKILERKGALLEWAKPGATETALLISRDDDSDRIFEMLRDHIVFRHPKIYGKPSS